MKKKASGLLALILILGTLSALPLSAGIDGLQAMTNVYNRPSGDEMSANLTMSMTNSRGSVRERGIVQYRIEENGIEKKIMFFTTPSDVRGTSFLSWIYSDGKADDQWIYLPALNRVRRISSDGQNESFMGSDFTYDDMGGRHPSEDTHTILRKETVDGQDCYVVQSVPNSPGGDFSKTLSWIIKDEWIGLKKEYYDTKQNLTKTLTINAYDKVDGIWVISDMTMRNLAKKTSTTIKMEQVSFTVGLSDAFFSERQMRIGPMR